ncbi:MAG: ribonuclease [Pseudomonadota bacterium]|jgi:ribonuclease D
MTEIMRIVTDTESLVAFCAELEKGPYVALDTEFMRDQTYWPKLCLIQAAGAEAEGVIDPLAKDIDLTPFYKLLASKKVMKVFHAARQDVEIFHHQADTIPDPIFDTQIAAMVCGFGEAASYETLVRRIAKAEVDKSARFTDWSRRPLSKRQLEYALADVTYLRVIYEYLAKDLEKSGRASWVEEEEATLKDPATYRLDPTVAWRRLKIRSNNKRLLTIAAALAEWREREAQTRDVPRNRILKDEALMEIAAHPPAKIEDFAEIRGLPSGYAGGKQGKSLFAAIAEAREATLSEHVIPLQGRRRGREPSAAALDLLKTLLRLRASEYGVAARLIADSEDIERLAAGEDEGLAVLQGWRAEVFGNDARDLRDGRLAIALVNGEAAVIENPHAGEKKTPRRKTTLETT